MSLNIISAAQYIELAKKNLPADVYEKLQKLVDVRYQERILFQVGSFMYGGKFYKKTEEAAFNIDANEIQPGMRQA
jgi:hypothetical protein